MDTVETPVVHVSCNRRCLREVPVLHITNTQSYAERTSQALIESDTEVGLEVVLAGTHTGMSTLSRVPKTPLLCSV